MRSLLRCRRGRVGGVGRANGYHFFQREACALASTVYRFNPVQESWSEQKCSGPTPPGLYDGVCASAGHHGYACGGNYGAEVCSLHQLDVRSMTWELLSNDGPSRKTGCRMIAYSKTLLIFGGYGRPSVPTQPGAQWERECTNELHTFEVEEGEGVTLLRGCISKLGHSCTQNHASCHGVSFLLAGFLPLSGTWHSPLVSGTRPPPCAWFSLTMTAHHLAVFFAGYQASSNSYCNDVYILDLRRMVSCLWVLSFLLEHSQPELVMWLVAKANPEH